MDISLHPDIERFIREQIGAGGYGSPGEVVTDALFLLWQRDHDPLQGHEPACAAEGPLDQAATPLAMAPG